MFTNFAGTWLPLLLIFLTTWITGLVMSTMPWSNAADTARTTPGHARSDDDESAPLGA